MAFVDPASATMTNSSYPPGVAPPDTCLVGTTEEEFFQGGCGNCVGIALPGVFCPGGSGNSQTPRLCRAGFFCSAANSEIVVPENSYSRQGFTAAVPCPFWASCPEGAASRSPSAYFLLLLVILVLVFAARIQRMIWRRKIRSQLQGKSASETRDFVGSLADDFVEKLRAKHGLTVANSSGKKRAFQGFTRSFIPPEVEVMKVSMHLKSDPQKKIVDDITLSLPPKCVSNI